MKSFYAFAAMLLMGLSPLRAEVITDDAGRQVDVPIPPQRVIATMDLIITLPLVELGINVVGSTTRINPNTGIAEIWNFETIFGMTPQEAGIQSITGSDGIDLERVQALDPDLIIIFEAAVQQIPVLEPIAPVFVQNAISDEVFGLSSMRSMAERFGAMERYNALEAEYLARVEDIKSKLDFDPSDKTFLAVLVTDQVMVANGISGATQAIADLGFQWPEWLEKGERAPLVPVSPERIDLLQADMLFMSGGFGPMTGDEATIRDAMSKLAPGWDRFVKPDLGIAFSSAEEIGTVTFYSAHRMLDIIEAHFEL